MKDKPRVAQKTITENLIKQIFKLERIANDK